MSTKAAIGIENDNGSILGIYCYYDGYFEGVGQILNKNYQDEDVVRRLIELGNIKHLGDNIWATEYFIREHHEMNNTPQILANTEDFERYFYKVPYYYIWSKNKWLCRQSTDIILNYCELSTVIDLLRTRNMLT